jgi:hypothetical protein
MFDADPVIGEAVLGTLLLLLVLPSASGLNGGPSSALPCLLLALGFSHATLLKILEIHHWW